MSKLNIKIGEHKIIRGDGVIVSSSQSNGQNKRFVHFENIEIDGEIFEKLNLTFGEHTKVTSYNEFEMCERTLTKDGVSVYYQDLTQLNGYKIKGNYHVAMFENSNPQTKSQSPSCTRILAVGAKVIEEPTIDTTLIDM